MEGTSYKRSLNNKRPNESENFDRPRKRVTDIVIYGDGVEKIYNVQVLLPNGTSLGLKFRERDNDMPIEQFTDVVKEEYFRVVRQTGSQKMKRKINWKSKDLHFVDKYENVIKKRVNFEKFKSNNSYIRLHDGSGEAELYENMWDLTPDTELLMELPEEYTFETALADLIDNSLQAVWSNDVNERRLISVDSIEDRISIFDSGPGMDNTDENSIVKWGKIGASVHRSSRGQAIGGNPPYLMPAFGMFGYGGPIASMHLGRHALVSSKSKESEKVYILRLEREALLTNSGSEKTWKTDGGVRNPFDDEIQKSPHGTFTMVEIFEPKMKSLDILQLQCKLKDIYFPYIQCDEMSSTGKTITPIEFQVNGIDLAELNGGEVAITNLHSCNGPEFVIQLHFKFNKDNVTTNSPGLRASLEANAKLKCVYFPIVEGKESIDRILEKLKAEGCEINETFESFSRVSIRRLGRLLPDARWTWLPFMEPRQKKGDRVQILKRCCLRVKCFIETDGGFKPTPSKTDLAHHHPFTTALKNLGSKPSESEREVNLQIYRDSKPLTLSQLERQYQEWIYQMHDRYDEEVDCGEDQPLHIISPSNKKGLGISSDVVRVHKVVWRKGTSWKSGQKIKVLKGACAGCHKNNIYATLECFLLEGFQGDAGGEARLICRPLGLADENGCKVAVNDGNTCIDIRGSLSLPINVIDSGKCLAIESAEWENQIEKQRLKTPSTIEILSAKYCQELEIEGALPFDNTIYAGHVPPKEIVAIVRPASFNSTSVLKKLDQKYIVRQNVEMAIEIKFRAEGKDTQVQHIYSGRIAPSSRKGFHGLYMFLLGCKCPKIFQKAGIYTFSFSLRELSIRTFERNVKVKALSEVERWGLLSDEQSLQYSVSVGSCFPPISIACYDKYDNHIAFTSVPELIVKINSDSGVLALVHKMKVDISRSMLILKHISIESNELDNIRPCYRANLVISPRDESFSVSIPCEVTPGSLHRITVNTQDLEKQLLPGCVIREFILEMFDAYGNHVKGGAQVLFMLDGFQFQDQIGFVRKVDDLGCIDLSGLLKVSRGYGTKVSISVLSSDKEVFRKEFQTEKRELIASSRVPKSCAVGSQLENIVFEVINSEGDVDETIHDEEKYGQSHTLSIKAESLNTDDYVRYSFRHGRCVVRAIPLPRKEGIFCFEAAHSRYPDLHLTIEVHVEQAQKVELESVQPHFSDGKVLLLPDPSTLKVPKVEDDDAHNQCSDGNILLLRNSPASEDVGNLLGSIINDQKEIEDDLLKSGLNVGHHEETLKMLNDQLVAIKNDISMLQDSMDLDLVNHTDYFPDKEVMMKRIESKTDSAAAVVCSLFRRSPSQEQHNQFTECILGVVALLGTVNSNGLSRILAEYLGEDQMLAVVCKSYAAADDLEKYEQNGIVNRGHALHGAAAELGKSIDGRYLVICLEEIRPYTGGLGSDSQKKLAIPDPTLPTGKSPPGYLGYAVNMINLDVHLHTKTAAGHGLRQTLFYRLFGELQVYETRENMKMATACIKHAAVSLDGGIMRGIGVISLGYGEPYIHFPVIASGSRMHPNPQSVEILQQIEEKEGDLRKTLTEIERVTRIHRKFMKRFNKKRDRYKKFLDEKGPLLGIWGLQV